MPLQHDRLGKNIHAYRIKHKLSQNDFAEMIGCTPEQLSRIENGHRRVQLDTLNNICEILDISYEELLWGATEAKIHAENEMNSENWASEEFMKIVFGLSDEKIKSILSICAEIVQLPKR